MQRGGALLAVVARVVVRARVFLALGWIAAAIACVLWLPSIDEAQSGGLGDLVPDDSAALETEERALELFDFPLFSRTIVVARDERGLSRSDHRRLLLAIAELTRTAEPPFQSILGALPVLNAVRLVDAPEAGTGLLAYLFVDPSVGQSGRTSLSRLFADNVAAEVDAELGVTGAVPAREARGQIILDRLPLVELVTLAIVLGALALFFRAPGVAGLNLLGVGIAYLVSSRLMGLGGELIGFSVPREIEPVIVALLFGVVTDYHLFVLSSYREHLRRGEGRLAAAQAATSEQVPVILTAGLIIAAAALSLLSADIGFVRAFGPGLAVAILVAVAVALTFMPAALAIAGSVVLWPGRPDRRPGGRVARGTLALAVRRPAVIVAVTGAALGACAWSVTDMKLGYPLLRGLPQSSEVKEGYRELARGFGAGAAGPTVLILEADSIADRRAALASVRRQFAEVRGVQSVIGPGSFPRFADPLVFSGDGDAARLLILLEHDPFSANALNSLRRMRLLATTVLRRAGLDNARFAFAGDTAITADTVGRTASALLEVAPLALLSVALLLAILLRALLAPLYIVAASLLAVLATLGLTVVFFQGILDTRELSFFVPFAASVLLLALGSDYSVFIVSRIWRRAETEPLREAVVDAGAAAAAAISIGGLVLAGSFAALALIPVLSFQQLAFAMATGLLIDVFVVRPLLVPALIVLFGRAGAWPGRRRREPAAPGDLSAPRA